MVRLDGLYFVAGLEPNPKYSVQIFSIDKNPFEIQKFD
jgi:hypothetical protein